MANLPSNLPALLRAEGLKVTATPGWKNRGRPRSTGGFAPVGILCHHTATTVQWSVAAVLRLLTGGRSGLPGPLCQLGLDRKGRVYVVAAGRANHAGKARSSGTVAAGDGNRLYIGIEAFNNGVGEPWPAVQYNAYVKLAAALCKHVTGNSAQTVRGHKETSTTGKIDPRFDMGAFRARVAKELAAPTPRKSPEEEPIMAKVRVRKLGGGKKKVNESQVPVRDHNMQAEDLDLTREMAEQLNGLTEAVERLAAEVAELRGRG